MASGLIYLAIIGMWVAYFLPRWVHNKNEFSGKHVERYKSALRVVAGNTPGARVGTGVIYTDVDRVARVAGVRDASQSLQFARRQTNVRSLRSFLHDIVLDRSQGFTA